MKVLQSEVNRVLSTTEYGLFRYEERPKFYEKKLMILIGEMAIKNLSKDLPIIVDKEYNILDGVYRFEANKSLKESIYYKISEVSSALDLMKAGALVHKPTDFEFLYFHRDKLAYRKVLEWSKILPYSFGEIIGIFQTPYLEKRSRENYNLFKNGLMEYKKEDDFRLKKVQEFIAACTQKFDYLPMEIQTILDILSGDSYNVSKAVDYIANLPFFNEFLKLYTDGHPDIQNFDEYLHELNKLKNPYSSHKDIYATETKYFGRQMEHKFESPLFPTLIIIHEYFNLPHSTVYNTPAPRP